MLGLFGRGAGRLTHSLSAMFATEFRGHLYCRKRWTNKRGESGMATRAMEHPKVVTPAEWVAARKELLKKEKEFSRLRDQLSRQRRELPWEKVEKAYVFDGPKGKETLGDLFGGRSQLIVYHFMLGPDWKEGCPSCSFISDHIDGSVVHLAARDVRLAVVSRAPLAEIEAFKKRMGWRVAAGTCNGRAVNFDYKGAVTTEGIDEGP